MHVVLLRRWIWDDGIVLELVDVSDEEDGCLCVWDHCVRWVDSFNCKDGFRATVLWQNDAEVVETGSADGEDCLHCGRVESEVEEICGLKEQ